MFAVQGASGEVVKSEWFRRFALNFELAFLSGVTARFLMEGFANEGKENSK